MADTSAAYNPAHHNIRRVSRIRLFLRALGVSFFSIFSVLIAFYAFIELAQVQDLLFDARPRVSQEVIYWAGFYAIGIAIWALPLVYTARLLILQNFDVIGIDTEERFSFYVFRLPSFYVVFAFAAVFIGVIEAATNLPAPLTNGGNPDEKPIRMFLEAHLITVFVATAGVLVLVLLRDLFIRGYGKWMEHMERTDPEGFKKTLIRIEKITRKRTRNLEDLDLHLSELKPDFLSMETWIAAQRVKAFMWRYMSRLTVFLLILVAIHFLSYSDLVGRFMSFPETSSHESVQEVLDFISDTLYLKRASFLFVIFGAWLPFATIFALLSNRFQFPFIATLFIVGMGLTLFIGDGHDVRVAALSTEQSATLKPLAFGDAVKKWKAASGWNAKGCEWLAEGAPELNACPRPILVAGEGGGSRAAFLLASVLGILEDESLDQVKRSPAARPFHQQLFAISSVSGSSIGATFFLGALKARPKLSVEDLKKALYRQRLWFKNVARASDRTLRNNYITNFVTYKDSLQAALSNDFISPAIIAYLARDVLILSRLPFVLDRAGVLETSWEQAFDNMYGLPNQTPLLTEPLQTMAPSEGAWTPLLFMNATSIETGRRVIITPVKIAEPLGDGSPIFIDAYDLHELLCSPYTDPNTNKIPDIGWLDKLARTLPARFSNMENAKCADRKPTTVDVRLSTAAGISSRSPFVSPHAVIRDTTSQITDSAVDGGYFDNSGAVTALEIANALKSTDKRLRPYIIQVSSEPDWFKESAKCGSKGLFSDRPRIPNEADFRPVGTIADLLTVNSTRVSRGYETILQLPNLAMKINDGLPSVSQFYICPQPKENFFGNLFDKVFNPAADQGAERYARIEQKTQEEAVASQFKSVSLSWWLSPPLQAFLDGQVYADHNIKERDCVISLLGDDPAAQAKVCPQVAKPN